MVIARWLWATPDAPGEYLAEWEPTSLLIVCIASATGWAGRALVVEGDDPLPRSEIARSAAWAQLGRALGGEAPGMPVSGSAIDHASADTGRRAPSGSGILLAGRVLLERSRVIRRLDTLLFESRA